MAHATLPTVVSANDFIGLLSGGNNSVDLLDVINADRLADRTFSSREYAAAFGFGDFADSSEYFATVDDTISTFDADDYEYAQSRFF